ncbi:MAG: hypothetical protein Q7S95_01500 [bacterium]|nr:hypothetical protein [bacterium]
MLHASRGACLALFAMLALMPRASHAEAPPVQPTEGTLSSVVCDTQEQIEDILRVFAENGPDVGKKKYEEYRQVENASGEPTCLVGEFDISTLIIGEKVGDSWEVEWRGPGEMYEVVVVKMRTPDGQNVFGTLDQFIGRKLLLTRGTNRHTSLI